MRLAKGPQPALDQRCVGQHPAVQGGMVHRQATLPEQLLDVPVAQGIAQIPADRLQDQRCLEVAAFEVVLGAALQLLSNRTQDHGPPPDDRATKSTAMPDEPSTPKFATGLLELVSRS